MKNFRKLFLVLPLFSIGCAVGPLVSQETARSVGQNHAEVLGGYGNAGYVFKANYGLTKDLDLGFQWESLSIGLRTKYSFINNQENGWSLAAALGAGASVGGTHYYADILGSYLLDFFEPYAIFRAVHVVNEPRQFFDSDGSSLLLTIDSIQYNYGQAILGSRFWITKNLILSVEVSDLLTLSDGIQIGNSLIFGGAIGVKF